MDKKADFVIEKEIRWQLNCPYKGVTVINLHSIAVTIAACAPPLDPRGWLLNTGGVKESLSVKL